jgi:tryptophan synthase alpha chain
MMSNIPSIRLMAHLVAGFPDSNRDFDVAVGMAAAGAECIEIQFPYSDPAADGPVIQAACGSAIEHGFTVDKGFDLVNRVCRHFRDSGSNVNGRPVRVFIMSYAGLVFARGVERFINDAAASGATGVIVPDFMPGYDEHLYEVAAKHLIAAVPVVAPSVTDERLRAILALDSSYLYASIRTGITGKQTIIDESVAEFLRPLRRPETTLIAGFGVSSCLQASALQKHADMLVVGTAFVKAVLDADRRNEGIQEAVKRRVADIIGRTGRIEKEKEQDKETNRL